MANYYKKKVIDLYLYVGDDTFEYIKEKTGFDLKSWLIDLKDKGTFKIIRK